jgi:hypothetical protein
MTCKKHIRSIAGHDDVMNVSVQLASNSGLQVRVNRKVDDTTAADRNKYHENTGQHLCGLRDVNHLI